jgi:hypothetical protein
MTRTRRLLAAVLTSTLMGTGLLASASTAAQADPQHGGDHTHLNSDGDRYVGEKIPIVGYLVGTGEQHDKTLILQRKRDGKWVNTNRLLHRADGRFKFPARGVSTPQTVRFRVMVMHHGRKLHVSEKLVVNVLPLPL